MFLVLLYFIVMLLAIIAVVIFAVCAVAHSLPGFAVSADLSMFKYVVKRLLINSDEIARPLLQLDTSSTDTRHVLGVVTVQTRRTRRMQTLK
jgi:hypothetical protein